MVEQRDEAYVRLHRSGPEWGEAALSNHGPMVVEVLARRDRGAVVPAWLDSYVGRLEEQPGTETRITDATWAEALGDMRRVGDWTAYFVRQIGERPWQEVLITWWPRLLPGIAGGSTHGVIRVGHAVRALLAGGQSEAAVTELAHALAYWAARSLAIPGVGPLAGDLRPAAALDALPRVTDQIWPTAARLGKLAVTPGWQNAVTALRPAADPDDAVARLRELVAAATAHYLGNGHASPVLLVHAATAPNAVLHTLPALPREYWSDAMAAAWAASAALVCAFASKPPIDVSALPKREVTTDDLLDRAIARGDEHMIKFADTAIDAYDDTEDPAMLAAALRATELIDV